MVIAELAVKYGELGVDEWEATFDKTLSRDAALRNLRTEPIVTDETGSEGSYAVERLYRARRDRPRANDRALDQRGVADLAFAALPTLAFAALPTVAFSFSAVGVLAVMLAFAEKEPAYLIPGTLAALGFAILGSVTHYIARLMRKA